MSMMIKRRMNHIDRLKHGNEEWRDDLETLKNMAWEFYVQLNSREGCCSADVENWRFPSLTHGDCH